MQLVKISKRAVAVLLATVVLTTAAATPGVTTPGGTKNTDKYGEGEGWVIHAHYHPKKDRTRCELIEYPTNLPGDKTKRRHVEDMWYVKGHKTALECGRR
jgi:hypothetical protein